MLVYQNNNHNPPLCGYMVFFDGHLAIYRALYHDGALKQSWGILSPSEFREIFEEKRIEFKPTIVNSELCQKFAIASEEYMLFRKRAEQAGWNLLDNDYLEVGRLGFNVYFQSVYMNVDTDVRDFLVVEDDSLPFKGRVSPREDAEASPVLTLTGGAGLMSEGEFILRLLKCTSKRYILRDVAFGKEEYGLKTYAYIRNNVGLRIGLFENNPSVFDLKREESLVYYRKDDSDIVFSFMGDSLNYVRRYDAGGMDIEWSDWEKYPESLRARVIEVLHSKNADAFLEDEYAIPSRQLKFPYAEYKSYRDLYRDLRFEI